MRDPSEKERRRARLAAARRLAPLYDELAPGDLAAGVEWSADGKASGLFLGTYSAAGLRRVVEHYGLDRLLAERGIEAFEVELDTSDPFRHEVRLREPGGATFLDLRARTALGRDVGVSGRLGDLPCLVVEWLSLENPHASFGPDRPPLPGQRRPGLGLAPEIEEVLVLAARRVGAAALVSWPQWFHNAWLYHPRWRFVDPRESGRFAALVRDLAHLDLVRAAWAVHLGCVFDRRGRPYEWKPGPLALPRTREAARHFAAPGWRAARLAAKARHAFVVDEARLARELAARGVAPP